MLLDKDTVDFLQKKGAIEILVEIGETPKRHKRLNNTLLMSSSTLQRRLNAGRKLGIWEQTLEEQDEGYTAKVYQLTDLGEELYMTADQHGLSLYHKQRRDMVRRIRKAESQTLIALSPPEADWLDDLEVEIEFEVGDDQSRFGDEW